MFTCTVHAVGNLAALEKALLESPQNKTCSGGCPQFFYTGYTPAPVEGLQMLKLRLKVWAFNTMMWVNHYLLGKI